MDGELTCLKQGPGAIPHHVWWMGGRTHGHLHWGGGCGAGKGRLLVISKTALLFTDLWGRIWTVLSQVILLFFVVVIEVAGRSWSTYRAHHSFTHMFGTLTGMAGFS